MAKIKFLPLQVLSYFYFTENFLNFNPEARLPLLKLLFIVSLLQILVLLFIFN